MRWFLLLGISNFFTFLFSILKSKRLVVLSVLLFNLGTNKNIKATNCVIKSQRRNIAILLTDIITYAFNGFRCGLHAIIKISMQYQPQSLIMITFYVITLQQKQPLYFKI